MEEKPSSNPYLRIIRNPQAYKNLGYLLLAFPTGLMYFLLLVIGSSLGFGLTVIGVGLLILWGTFVMTQFGAKLERWLANVLLGANIPDHDSKAFSLQALSDGNNWRAILFLFLKFPLGIFTFILTTAVISLVFGLIAAPFAYSDASIIIGFREIDTLWESLLASVFGIALLPLALVFLGKIAQAWRSLATSMLKVDNYTEKQKRKRAMSDADRLRNLIEDTAEDADVAYYEETSKGVLTG